jgi:hypothetical protein
MVNGVQTGQMAGTSPLIGWFRYFPNGTSDPSVASCVGPLARYISSITYSATGVQTIVFTDDFTFGGDLAFFPQAVFAAVANAFSATQMDAYNATTRTLVIQQHNTTTGDATAASSDAFVNVFVYGDQSAV